MLVTCSPLSSGFEANINESVIFDCSRTMNLALLGSFKLHYSELGIRQWGEGNELLA